MSYAKYEKSRVIQAAEDKIQFLRAEMDKLNEKQEKRKEELIQEAMAPKWFRRALDRNEAEIKVEQEYYVSLSHRDEQRAIMSVAGRAQKLKLLAETCDSETVALNVEDAAFLFNTL